MSENTEIILNQAAAEEMRKHDLPIIQVLQNGPRYAAVTTRTATGDLALFKMVLPEALEYHSPQDKPLADVMRKEVELMRFLLEHEDRLHGFTSKLYDYSPEKHWYLREMFRGRPLGKSNWPFRFDPTYYSEVDPKELVAYFVSLHAMSDRLPERFVSELPNLWPFERHVTELVEVLHHDFNHEFVQEHHGKIGGFIRGALPNVAANRSVITHREPFGVHTFLRGGKVGYIDWERAALGHRLVDPMIIWVRSFDNPEWQTAFRKELERVGYLGNEANEAAWDMLVLIECISGFNHFKYWPHLDKEYQAALDGFFVETIREIVPRVG